MLRVGSALAILSGGLLVAGCQSTAAKYAQLNAGIRVPEAAGKALRSEQQLSAGRSALEQRNYAAAIMAFREASVEAGLRPAALNGLGVAYAGIGREDLAETYFRRAINLDPSNTKYDDNLARLYRVQLAAAKARREKSEEKQRVLAARERAQREREIVPGVRMVATARRMVQTSPGMVSIITSDDKVPSEPAQAQLAVISPPSATNPAKTLPQVAAVSAPGLRPGAAVTIAEPMQGPAIVVVGRDALVAMNGAVTKPVAVAISATGRLYRNPAEVGPSSVVDPSQAQASVQLADNHSIGQTILGPLTARESILGLDSGITLTNEAE